MNNNSIKNVDVTPLNSNNNYTCNLCNKTLKSNCIYQRHINQKIKCNVNKEEIIIEKDIIKCDLCNKTFRSEYLLNKHINSKNKCNDNKINNENNNENNNEILDIKQIKKKIYNLHFQITKKITIVKRV
jgi:hypothetical protein